MGFWIFMLIMDLLLPFTMIGFGRYFMKKDTYAHHPASDIVAYSKHIMI